MTRITNAGILVAILVASIFAIQAQTPSVRGQGLLVVDDDGLDVDCIAQYGGGVVDSATINGAIALAAPGDTIVVCRGTYNEHVIINVTDLTLLGFGCSETIIEIDPPGTSNGISILVDGATIGHFEITGGINGIESASGTQINSTLIKHNCIHDSTEDGINFDKGSNNIIRDNEIFENGLDGIDFGDTTNMSNLTLIIHNKVHDNGANGIRTNLTSSMGNEISHNQVRDNGPAHWGIDVDSDILVKGNTVVSNRGGILARGDGNTFDRNASNQNEQEGFRTLSTASMNTFDKNKANFNEQGFSDQGTMNTFTNNMAKNNTLQGFVTTGSDGVFTANLAKKNLGNGFEAGAASFDNSFDSNRSNKNGGFGFFDASVGPANTYVNNKCNNNFDGGSDPSGLCTPQL